MVGTVYSLMVGLLYVEREDGVGVASAWGAAEKKC